MKHKRICTTKVNDFNDINWLELTKGMEEMTMEVTGVEEVAKDMFVVEKREVDRSKIRKRGSR